MDWELRVPSLVLVSWVLCNLGQVTHGGAVSLLQGEGAQLKDAPFKTYLASPLHQSSLIPIQEPQC